LELGAGTGIKQWTWLPTHRTRKYIFEILARSPNVKNLRATLTAKGQEKSCADATVIGLNSDWKKLRGELSIPSDAPADAPYSFTLTSPNSGQLVIAHIFLWPADNINGADPDVIRFLKGSHLPLLRWPGGNFVSAYHWEDGVGPVEGRPTKPNYAWGSVEPNTFGTDEFIAFCRAVGCEPMMCINAGTGTPEEAARWIEYCNGPASSKMGARRAANGHPKPYNINHWEVGNELWGRWQANWTTASGYVDRYHQFAKAMRKADASIELHACGAPVLWGKGWNDTLIHGIGAELHSITDHPLIGGDLSFRTDPLDVFRDFMHVPDLLETKWMGLREDMLRGGAKEPRLAVTELQMFAHLHGQPGAGETATITQQTLVTPGTLGEALYDTLIYHAAVRLQPFVEMITHSATVNHGGGLRKEHERIFANPCHYANEMFAEFGGARPVETTVTAPQETAPLVLPEIKNSGGASDYKTLSALAGLTSKKDLLVSLVNRSSGKTLKVKIDLRNAAIGKEATLTLLTGDVPWAANTLEKPETIVPATTKLRVEDSSIEFTLPPYSVAKLRIPAN